MTLTGVWDVLFCARASGSRSDSDAAITRPKAQCVSGRITADRFVEPDPEIFGRRADCGSQDRDSNPPGLENVRRPLFPAMRTLDPSHSAERNLPPGQTGVDFASTNLHDVANRDNDAEEWDDHDNCSEDQW